MVLIDIMIALQAELVTFRDVTDLFLEHAGISKRENIKEVMNASTAFLRAFIEKVFGQSYTEN